MKPLPSPPGWRRIIGPSFILLGLALGSGELIFWPYLSANWGLGLVWGAWLGISFQFFLNTEVMRYALYWGESVFVGFFRLGKGWPAWFVLSTFVPWSLPGFSSASAQIFARLFGWNHPTALSVGLLVLAGAVLSLGRSLYKTMEGLQKAVIFLGVPFVFFLALALVRPVDWADLARGMVGQGGGWWFFPPSAPTAFLASFLAAVAYSGAGGNLNLAQSYYAKEKGMGMGRWSVKIKSLFYDRGQKGALKGERFADNRQNRLRFRQWWRVANIEHALVFWLLGLLMILLLSILAKALVFGQAGTKEGIEFLYQESVAIRTRLAFGAGPAFLLVAGLMLYSTQVGVLESSSRIISENLALLKSGADRPVNLSLYFYLALWFQIILGVALLLIGFDQPRALLTLAAVLNALAMTVSFPLVWFLNRRRLKKGYRMGGARKIIFLLAIVFFAVFDFLVIRG